MTRWGLLFLVACGASRTEDGTHQSPTPVTAPGSEVSAGPTGSVSTPSAMLVADVVGVSVSGAEKDYQFVVTLRSPDVDCDQYADWWEVVSLDGDLLYRRILNHSHPDEQPFARSGGPVTIDQTTEVVVRGHLHPTGYGGQVWRGSVAGGFGAATVDPGFAEGLASSQPLPEDCWY